MKIDIAPSLYLYFRFKQEGAMLVSEKKRKCTIKEMLQR